MNMPASPAPSRLGQQMHHNGHTYELQAVRGGAHRWVRVDKEPEAPPIQAGAKAGQAAAQDGIDPNSGDDPAARHQFTRSQLKGVQGPARGVMAAFHEHPEVAGGGATVTRAFAPAQAKQTHQWLARNAGKTVGSGQVVDLGAGRYGYATPAGSIVVWPPDSSGKHQIKFTNQTGVVSRAMGGGPAPANTRQGANAGPAAAPVDADNLGTGPRPVQSPPGTQAKVMPPGEKPPIRTSPKDSAFANRLTPEAAAAVGGIMDKPEKSQPARPSTPRAAADEAKERLNSAIEQWQQEVAGGLTPKGNARWRSYTAALRSIWQQHEQLARDWEKKSKGGGKAGGVSVPGGAPDDEISELEAKVTQYDPNAIKTIKSLTQRPESYKDLLTQYAEAIDPDWAAQRQQARGSGGRRQPEGGPRSDTSNPLFEGRGTDAPKEIPSERSIEQSVMNRLGIDPDTGNPVRPSKREIERQLREEARKGFGLEAPPQPSWAKLPPKQRKLAKLAHEKYLDHFGVSPSDHNKAAIEQAIQSGHIKTPRDLRTVLRTAKNLHGRGNLAEDDHAHLKESIRRKANRERRESYQGLVKKQASEWDMKPEEYHSLAQEIYPDYIKHHEEREAAKKHAREATGLTAREINRMENEGLDSASARRFDTIGRELADNYPGIFGGTGYGDEGSTDYGSALWDLIKEGAKKVPGKASKEFHDHVDEFLRSQLKGGKDGSGNVADDDDLAMTPFLKGVNGSIRLRYGKWLRSRAMAWKGRHCARQHLNTP